MCIYSFYYVIHIVCLFPLYVYVFHEELLAVNINKRRMINFFVIVVYCIVSITFL